MTASFREHLDLASERLGGAAIATSDDFFAEVTNLTKPAPAVWKGDAYTDRGKWMDGWESRRKRIDGEAGDDDAPLGSSRREAHDWAIVRLGLPGVIRGVVVDTAFFRGNYPESCAIDGCAAPTDAFVEDLTGPNVVWTELVSRTKLQGNAENELPVASPYAFTHVRLRIFPDGGVARLRVHGDVVPDYRRTGHGEGVIDLASVEQGGDVVRASDMFFGERRNLIMPGRAANMSDGWETKRRRGDGNDWAILRLAGQGTIARVEIDTAWFKGNFPDTASLEAIDWRGTGEPPKDAAWRPLLPRTKLQAHTRHRYQVEDDELFDVGPITHVRLSSYPCGGVSRLRVFGRLTVDAKQGLGLARLNTLPEDRARAELQCCNEATRWIDALLATRPFSSREALFATHDAAWAKVSAEGLREAIAGHPRIGARKAAAWSAKEQAGMNDADDAIRAAILEKNEAYEAKHGFTYIVCATGKSAAELLAILEARLANATDEELTTAKAELHKITALRLDRLLAL